MSALATIQPSRIIKSQIQSKVDLHATGTTGIQRTSSTDLTHSTSFKDKVAHFLSEVIEHKEEIGEASETAAKLLSVTESVASFNEHSGVEVSEDTTRTFENIQTAGIVLETVGAAITLAGVTGKLKKADESIEHAKKFESIKGVHVAAEEVILHQKLEKIKVGLTATRAITTIGGTSTEIASQIAEHSTRTASETAGHALTFAGHVLHIAGGFVAGVIAVGSFFKNVFTLIKSGVSYVKNKTKIAQAKTPQETNLLKAKQTMLKHTMKTNGVHACKNAFLGTSSGISIALSFGAAAAAATPIIGWAFLGAGILIGIGVGIYTVVQKRKQAAQTAKRQQMLQSSVHFNRATSLLKTAALPSVKKIDASRETLTVGQAKTALTTSQEGIDGIKTEFNRLMAMPKETLKRNFDKVMSFVNKMDTQMTALLEEQAVLNQLIETAKGHPDDQPITELQTSVDKKSLDAMNLGLSKGDINAIMDVVEHAPHLLGNESFFGIDLAEMLKADPSGKLIKDWFATKLG